MAIDNQSDRRILSWRLLIYNPQTLQYDHANCLLVPRDDGAGMTFFPSIQLNDGQRFVLESYRDRKDCGGDMWAGQGYTMGGAGSDNYAVAKFTMGDPDNP